MVILKYLDIASDYYAATSKYHPEQMVLMIYTAHHNCYIVGEDREWLQAQQEVKQAILN